MNKLLQMLDRVRPEIDPLDEHYLSNETPLARDRYLTLLAANLLEVGALSEARSRLFDMLITSMETDHSASFYMQQANALEHNELKEILLYLREDKERTKAYLFDLLVLLRIDSPLSCAEITLIEQQFTVLLVTEREAKNLVFWFDYLTQGKPLSIYETNVDLHEIIYAECVLKSDRDILSNFNCISSSLKPGKIYNENEFYTGGSISSYFSDAGISYNYYYCVNKVRFPRGLLVSIYAPIKNFSSKLWSFGGKAPALCMIPYPNGLSTWCRFFDSEEI